MTQTGPSCVHARNAFERLLRAACLLFLTPLACSAADEPAEVDVVELRHYDKQVTIRGGSVYSVAFSPDSKWALIGGDVPVPEMLLWDVKDGHEVRRFPAPTPRDPLIQVAYSPDGILGAAGTLSGIIQIWEVHGFAIRRSMTQPAPVAQLNFSPDGQRVVTAGDNMTYVWDVNTGTELLVLRGHNAMVRGAAFVPQRDKIATSSIDGTIRIWRADDGGQVQVLQHPEAVWSLAVSPDGRYLAGATGGAWVGVWTDQLFTPGLHNEIYVWETDTGRLAAKLSGHTHSIRGLAFAPDNKTLASGSFDKTLRIWDVESGKQLGMLQAEGWFNALAFSPKGRFLLSGGGLYREVGGINRPRQPSTIYPNERIRLFRLDRRIAEE